MKILFGTNSWPCGVLDIGSYLASLRLAEIRIAPIIPGVFDRLGSEFRKIIAEFRPDFIGLRIEGGMFELVCKQIREIREISDTPIILGGPGSDNHPHEIVSQSGADYIFIGEAELTLAEFIKNAVEGKFPPHSVIYSPDRPSIEVLRGNRLDFSLLEGYENHPPFDSLYFTSSRGCPGKCAFCTKQHGSQFRAKLPQQLLEEIEAADHLVKLRKIGVSSWKLFEHLDESFPHKDSHVSWASVYDEDFFLDRDRSCEFFRLWKKSPLRERYRLSFQTNPCSLLDEAGGKIEAELWNCFNEIKPMIQLGAESFHRPLLERWNKRHSLGQLEAVLDSLDETKMDYTVFHIQCDYDTDLPELFDSSRALLAAARRHPRMRIASSPFMIPLYGTEIHRRLESAGRLKIGHFTELDMPHPEWIASELARLADLIDEELQWALYPQRRETALENIETILSHYPIP